jgi:hypothetical protein
VKWKVHLPSNDRLVRVSCYLALGALPLMVWSVLDPTVWPVLMALSAGQAIGTLSLSLFLVVVARDLNVRAKIRHAAREKEN